MAQQRTGAYLIVNADDYGYYRCVSRGILKAARHGIVTATGVFANAPDLAESAAQLRDCAALDTGVHLNLTQGMPLTTDLGHSLARWSGRFPGKFAITTAILSGAVKTGDVSREWRAQIERCLERGLAVQFLNSHEHVHMLPPLFAVVRALAKEFGIRHVRFPTSRRDGKASGGALMRGALMKGLETLSRRHANAATPKFLGLEPSGRLDLQYLARSLPNLAPGEVYELMCHPGELDAREVTDARLLDYHDWEGELSTLTNPAARELLQRHRIQLVGYRHLDVVDDRLVVHEVTA